MTDRSGRTLKEYRDLYWAEKKRRKELEAEVEYFRKKSEDTQSNLNYSIQNKQKLEAQIEAVEKITERLETLPNETQWTRATASEYRAALGEQE
jgi:hypothetical protein